MAQLRLRAPMEHQRSVLLSPARHKVLACGRRWGKTGLKLLAAIDGHGPTRGFWKGALQGGHVLWLPPTYPMVVEVWEQLDEALAALATKVDKDNMRISLPTGGWIMVRSGERKDACRGLRLDMALVDEAASHRPKLWKEELAPALSDSRGSVIFGGTPKGRDNWFYDLYEQAAELEGWERWQRPSSDNPLMTPEELRARRRESGPFAFEREYLAAFNVANGDFFRSEWLHYYDELAPEVLSTPGIGTTIRADKLERYAVADFALTTKSRSDWTVVMVCGVAPDGRMFVLHLERKKLDGPKIVPHLQQILKDWKCPVLYMETNGLQALLFEEARRELLPVVGVHVDKDKVTRAIPAQVAMETGRIWFPRRAEWLEDFKAELFSFPPEDKTTKDDQVDALSAAAAVLAGDFRREEGGEALTIPEREERIPRMGARSMPSLLPPKPPRLGR